MFSFVHLPLCLFPLDAEGDASGSSAQPDPQRLLGAAPCFLPGVRQPCSLPGVRQPRSFLGFDAKVGARCPAALLSSRRPAALLSSRRPDSTRMAGTLDPATVLLIPAICKI
ncbi:hypothetical protein ACP70R_048834 [Stipagrostis hirtigluma subsp. patula]